MSFRTLNLTMRVHLRNHSLAGRGVPSSRQQSTQLPHICPGSLGPSMLLDIMIPVLFIKHSSTFENNWAEEIKTGYFTG